MGDRYAANPKGFAKGKHRKEGAARDAAVGGTKGRRATRTSKRAGARVVPRPVAIHLRMRTKSMLMELLKELDAGSDVSREGRTADASRNALRAHTRFKMGSRVMVETAEGARPGRITHVHKDATYTVTYVDPDLPQGEQPREKHVAAERIQPDRGGGGSDGESDQSESDEDEDEAVDEDPFAEKQAVLDNLRLLKSMERADKNAQAKAATASTATAISATATPHSAVVLKPKVRLMLADAQNSKIQKMGIFDRKGGLGPVLTQAKNKLKLKKKPKSAVVAATGDELVDLDTVADDSVVLVSPTPSAAVPSSATKSGVGASITAEDGAAGGGGSGAPAGQSSPSSSAGGPTQDSTLVGDGGDASVGDRAGDSAGMAGKVARIREMLAARNSGRDRGWQSTTPTSSAAASARLKAHQDRLETADDGEVGRLRRQREKLPAFAARRELVEMINGCPGRVCVVSGSTGCGKTTQVPQFLLEDAIRRGTGGECSIVCTQPRRISAIGVAERVAVERGERCGDTVGYAIRLESRISAETRLSFLTTGLLLRRLISDPTLKGVTHIIVDEIHERSCLVDFILIILRKLLKVNLQLRVVLMSATVESETFAKYFGDDCPTLTIPGFTFPVNVLYAEDAVTMAKYNPQRGGPQQQRQSSGRGGRGGRGGGRASGGDGRGGGGGGRCGHHRDSDRNEAPADAVRPPSAPQGEQYNDGTEWSRYAPRTRAMVEQIDHDTTADKIEYGLIEALLLYIERVGTEARKGGGDTAATATADAAGWETVGERARGEAASAGDSRETLTDAKTAGALGKGSVLVFLPGIAEITKLLTRIQSNGGLRAWHVVPLHSSLPSRDQRLIFSPPPKGMRKVVLATNIAETSITIEDCTVVIDCGRVKEMRYDANRRMGILEQVWTSRASATQRSGRAGRVQEGVCFRLYAQDRLCQMRKHTSPEIKRVPLEDLVMQVKLIDLGDAADFLAEAITPPEARSVQGSIANLVGLGALSAIPPPLGPGNRKLTYELTPLGVHLAMLPIDARLGKMLIFACLFGCLDPIVTIAATMSLKSPFQAPFGKQGAADAAKKLFAGKHMSDHLAMAAAYDGWVRSGRSFDFARKHFLNHQTLQQIGSLRDQLFRQLREAGFIPTEAKLLNANVGNTHLLRCVICAALYPNVARLTQKGDSGDLVTISESVSFHPSSVNTRQSARSDRWFVYLEKVETSKVFLRDSTAVSAYALLLFGGQVDVVHDRDRIVVDRWIVFRAEPAVGILFRLIREELDAVLLRRIASDGQQADVDPRTRTAINGTVKFLAETDELRDRGDPDTLPSLGM